MFVLPVSRVSVAICSPDGKDELLLAEGVASPVWLRIGIVRRLAPPRDSSSDWNFLPYPDVDAALLAVRQRLYGDRILAEIRCDACGAWGDVSLSVDQYLSMNRPRPLGQTVAGDDGWWEWKDVRFRVPTVSAVWNAVEKFGYGAGAAGTLLRYCAGGDSPEVMARVSSVLKRVAPPLAGLIQGFCPQCGEPVRGWFDPGGFVIEELRARASIVFEHVHLLAQAYGWTEDLILALPSQRREIYAARIAEGRRE
jgi:hypothetical protein